MRKSDSAKDLWMSLFGTLFISGTENRWFAWLEWVVSLFVYWRVIPNWVTQCDNSGYMPAKVTLMKSICNIEIKHLGLGIEMKYATLIAPQIISACYFLEGNYFAAVYAFTLMAGLNQFFTNLFHGDHTHPLYVALLQWAQVNRARVSEQVATEEVNRVWASRTALCLYWSRNVWIKMKLQLLLFKGFAILDPLTLVELSNQQILDRLTNVEQSEFHVTINGAQVRRVKGMKGFTKERRDGLLCRISHYRAAVNNSGIIALLTTTKRIERPEVLWRWWKSQKDDLPIWFKFAKDVRLHQASSASVERFFSVIKGDTSPQQIREDPETIEARCIAKYNAMKNKDLE